MQIRGEQAAVAQHTRNINDAKSWLAQGDSTIREMLDTTRKVRDLTVQGLNTGAVSDTSQQALATEVTSLREGLLGLANTLVQGRPLFGGLTPGNKSYNDDGTWAGLAGPQNKLRVSESEQVRVDLTGPEAFGPDGANLFDIVGRIAANLTGDPAALAVDLADLDTAMQRMSTSVADIGTRAARVDRAELMNFDRSISLKVQLGETENVDLPNTIMQLEMRKVGYEAALAATAKAISPTLMDYLR
jgi:flagellar hook-associated protein 3 FlgL